MTTLPWSKGLHGVLRMAVSEKTRVTLAIGALLSILGAIATGAWVVAGYAKDITYQISDLRRDVSKLGSEQFTVSMASEYALRDAIANPGRRVPDPRNPGQFFEVRNGVGK